MWNRPAPPPTSSCIRDHIHRAAYLVHAACSLVSNRPGANAGLREHGWIEQSGTMLPCKSLKPLPPQVLSTCGCGGTCDTNKCKRYANGVKYEMFCPGKTADSLCKNNHGERELFCVSCNAYDSKYCLLMINMCTINILIMAMHISFMT